MTPKITLDITDSKCMKCGKVGRTDRHHVRHEKLILNAFGRNPNRSKTKTYLRFQEEYYLFRPKDVALLCRDCHGLIHERYYYRLIAYLTGKRKDIESLSWREARALMNIFRKEYDKWITTK